MPSGPLASDGLSFPHRSFSFGLAQRGETWKGCLALELTQNLRRAERLVVSGGLCDQHNLSGLITFLSSESGYLFV